MLKFIKTLCVLLSVSILVGCSPVVSNVDLDSDIKENESMQETFDKDEETVHIPEETTEYKVTRIENFVNDRAWVHYSVSKKIDGVQVGLEDYLGCVNKQGKVLFAIKRNELDTSNFMRDTYSSFNEDVAFIKDSNGVYHFIDIDGNELFTSNDEGFSSISSYGDGYFCTYAHVSGFEATYESYKIIDKTGKVLSEKKCEYQYSSEYIGSGVFKFSIRGNDYEFYSVTDNKWYTIEDVREISNFENGRAFLWIRGTGFASPHCYLLYSDGTTKELKYPDPYNDYVDDIIISDGTILFAECRNDARTGWDPVTKIIGYNIEEDFTFSTEAIDQYVPYMFSSSSYTPESTTDNEKRVLRSNDGIVVLNLRGTDEKPYVAMVNMFVSSEAVIEPTLCTTPTQLFCERVIIKTENATTIYDISGSPLFTLGDINASFINDYSDDVAIVDNVKCIDKDGNYLFSQIDFSSYELLFETNN